MAMQMEVDVDALFKAGKILEGALELAWKLLDDGERSGLKIADAVEAHILEHAKPAFPCNVGPDRLAAHFAPTDDRPGSLEGAHLVKIDAGVHVGGWIADAAFTYPFDEEGERLALAAREALLAAAEVIRPGASVADVGKAVSEVAKRHGLKPIVNLGGHEIKQYNLHAGLFVPNVPQGKGTFEEGMIVAVEPFLSTGRGRVEDGSIATIFSLMRPRARGAARQLLDYIRKEYRSLPFAEKWVVRRFGSSARLHLYTLVKSGAVYAYPELLEIPGSLVGQFETTFYVDRDGGQPVVDTFKFLAP